MNNPNMWHLHEQIFGHLNHKTVEICRRVCKVWRESLEKISHVKFIEEFGDRYVEYGLYSMENGGKVSNIIRGWKNAVKKYAAKATIKDLQEVIDVLLWLLIKRSGMVLPYPVHCAARGNSNALKLMEIVLNTSYDFNTRDIQGYTIFHCACAYGRTKLVQFMIKSSKDFSIDLNANTEFRGPFGLFNNRWTDVDTETAFHLACNNGCTEIVELMIKSSKDFSIDLNARTHSIARTALHAACYRGQTNTIKIILENWKEFGIDIKAQDKRGGRSALDITKSCIQGGPLRPYVYQQIKEMLENEYSKMDVTDVTEPVSKKRRNFE